MLSRQHQRFVAPHLEEQERLVPNNKMQEDPVIEQAPAAASVLVDDDDCMDLEPHDRIQRPPAELNQDDIEMLFQAFGQVDSNNIADMEMGPLPELEPLDRPLDNIELALAMDAFGGDDEDQPHAVALVDEEEEDMIGECDSQELPCKTQNKENKNNQSHRSLSGCSPRR